MSVCFFHNKNQNLFSIFVVISQRQAKLSRFGDLKTVNYKLVCQLNWAKSGYIKPYWAILGQIGPIS